MSSSVYAQDWAAHTICVYDTVVVLTCTAAKPSHHERAAGQSPPSDPTTPREVKQTGQIDFLSRSRCLARSATAECCRPRRSVGQDRRDMRPLCTCGALGRKSSGQTGASGAVETKNNMNNNSADCESQHVQGHCRSDLEAPSAAMKLNMLLLESTCT